MRLKALSRIVLTMLLIGMLTLAFNIQSAKASGTVYIRADGSVDPPTAPISSVDNVTYTFTGNIYDEIVVERNNIVVDGASFTLQGAWGGTGIDLTNRSNVTIKNMKIKAFYIGIYLSGSSNNTIQGNNITDNRYGIDLHWSSNNTVSANNVANNDYGIWLYDSSNNSVHINNITNNHYGFRICFCAPNNKIYHNNIIQNWGQVYHRASTNVWDDGYPSGGNYWSNYAGVDVKSGPNQDQSGSDNIGDTPYVTDVNNIDHYPLMYPWGSHPPPTHTLTIYSTLIGITFSVDGISRATPWSGNYSVGVSVSLVMSEFHIVGDARYCWDQWSDGNTSRSRTVTANTNITLTAYYSGPYYQLTVTSSPITGVTFTINGTLQTTPYTEWLLEGSFTLEMPETHDGYIWSHWLEDGTTNRIKTILLQGTTWTAVYTPTPPPPVGGKATPINKATIKPKIQTPCVWLTTIIFALFATVFLVKFKKKKQ